MSRKMFLLGICLGQVFISLSVAKLHAVPEDVLEDSEGISGFELYGKGALWWDGGGTCGEFYHQATIRSRFSDITVPLTRYLAEHCEIMNGNVSNAVRGDTFVYFFADRIIRRKPLYAGQSSPYQTQPLPLTIPILDSDQKSTYLELQDDRLYWGRYRSATGSVEVFWGSLDGSQGGQIFQFTPSVPAEVKKLKPFIGPEGFAILLANGELYRHDSSTNKTSLIGRNVADFALHSVLPNIGAAVTTYLYAARGDPNYILPCDISAGSLLEINLRTNHAHEAYRAEQQNQIIAVGVDPGNTIENLPGFPKRIYIAEAGLEARIGYCRRGNVSILRNRLLPTSNSWETICLEGGGINLRSDGDWLYFLNDSTIYRLKTDAPPMEYDISAIGLEIVQTVQNWNHTAVIVAGKQGTTVRGYATVVANNTPSSISFPSAWLEAEINNQPLPGSPFISENNAEVSAEDDLFVLRQERDRSFIFQLPPIPEGTLELTLHVNPSSSPAETGDDPYSNNTISRTITVAKAYNPCLVMVPMPTPAGAYDTIGSDFLDIIARAESLLPVTRLDWTNWGPLVAGEQDIILDEVWFPKGSYNFDDSDDDQDNDALDAVESLRQSSSSPSGYSASHWVGMIHPGITGFGGLGKRPGRSVIASMQNTSVGMPWDDPEGGTILAHELGHNYNRKHVDCPPGGPANIDDNYPYPPCLLGSGGGQANFGYDPISESVIHPFGTNGAADLMTYESPTWISDYTWNAIYNYRSALMNLAVSINSRSLSEGSSDHVLFVNGRINTNTQSAFFRSFFARPETDWDTAKLIQAEYESAQAEDDPNPFLIRLLDDRGVLISTTALPIYEYADGPAYLSSFSHYIPFHQNARLVQLVREGVDKVWAERMISEHAPTISLAEPIIDETNKTIALEWSAEDQDGDYLRFMVHYSPNSGQEWFSYCVNFPGNSIIMSYRNWQASGMGTGLIRVTATDGVLATSVISNPFTIVDRGPEPLIGGVREGERIPFASGRFLFGLGLDNENGSDGVSITWEIIGPSQLVSSSRKIMLRPLPPGGYVARLTAQDGEGNITQKELNFEILPMTIPNAPTPKLDGWCADSGYAESLYIRPAMDGAAIPVRLLHSDGALWVSFSEIPYRDSSQDGVDPASVGVTLAINSNESGSPNSSHLGFLINQEGVPYQKVGDGSSMVIAETPRLGYSAIINPGENAWSAELRINEELLSGWNHAGRIILEHNETAWPDGASQDIPATWPVVYFQSQLPSMDNRPPIADAGQPVLVNLLGTSRTIVLDGGNSQDPDGDQLAYQWSQTSGDPVDLVGENTVNPSFIVNRESSEGLVSREFELIVSDGELSSDPSRVTVTTAVAQLPDYSEPRTIIFHGDNFFGIRYQGLPPGSIYDIEASNDLENWDTIATNVVDSLGVLDFIDFEAGLYTSRFYRNRPTDTGLKNVP